MTNKEQARIRAREWHRANPDKAKSSKLFKAYGITIEQYNQLNAAYDNVCHICGNECPTGRKLAVDHDHKTDLVRGLLCVNCNKGLGNFKDNIELLKKAISYLENADDTERHVNAAYSISKQTSLAEKHRDRNES